MSCAELGCISVMRSQFKLDAFEAKIRALPKIDESALLDDKILDLAKKFVESACNESGLAYEIEREKGPCHSKIHEEGKNRLDFALKVFTNFYSDPKVYEFVREFTKIAEIRKKYEGFKPLFVEQNSIPTNLPNRSPSGEKTYRQLGKEMMRLKWSSAEENHKRDYYSQWEEYIRLKQLRKVTIEEVP